MNRAHLVLAMFAFLCSACDAMEAAPAAAASVVGTLGDAPWTAVSAAIEEAPTVKPGKVWIRISAETDKQPALIVTVPRAVGTYAIGVDANATMFIPPGGNEGAEDGSVSITELREDGSLVLKLEVVINSTNRVAGSIVVAAATP